MRQQRETVDSGSKNSTTCLPCENHMATQFQDTGLDVVDLQSGRSQMRWIVKVVDLGCGGSSKW
jgi:hypothetical protein